MVTVNDAKELNDNPDAKELISSGIKVIAGSHPIELLDESFSFMVKNPGIPYNNPMVKRALELGIPAADGGRTGSRNSRRPTDR